MTASRGLRELDDGRLEEILSPDLKRRLVKRSRRVTLWVLASAFAATALFLLFG